MERDAWRGQWMKKIAIQLPKEESDVLTGRTRRQGGRLETDSEMLDRPSAHQWPQAECDWCHRDHPHPPFSSFSFSASVSPPTLPWRPDHQIHGGHSGKASSSNEPFREWQQPDGKNLYDQLCYHGVGSQEGNARRSSWSQLVISLMDQLSKTLQH